jgi:RNA polymerase sigma factor (sigma-70 family)
LSQPKGLATISAVGGAALGLEGVGRLPVTSGLLSDDRLARRAADGDGAAFAVIYTRYHQPLYRYCLSIVRNPEDAQDALQNAMVKALRGLATRDHDLRLRPWLFRIAHNESISMLRRRGVARTLDEGTDVVAPGPQHELDARSRLGQLVSDLQRLPERPRGALVMRELVGLDYEEIAAAMGVSAAAARQMVYEARVSLHEFAEGRAMACEDVRRSISDGDRRRIRSRRLRVHLSECPECRHFAELIASRRRELAALAPPLPLGTAASVLHAILGSGGGGSSGGGLLASISGGAGQLAGALTGVKGLAATVALVTTAAVGLATKTEPDPAPPKRHAVSTAVVTRQVSALPAPAGQSRPAHHRTRGDDRKQHTRRARRVKARVLPPATPPVTPPMTKGAPLDRADPAVHREVDPAPAPPAAAAPPAAPPPSQERETGSTAELLGGLVSETTALAAPVLALEEKVAIEEVVIELSTLNATELLRSNLLVER